MQESSVKRLSERVVRVQRDGRRCFDPQAKRELVQACLQPGVSVAGLALQHGVNANLLRKWIKRHRVEHGVVGPQARVKAGAMPAFIPVVAVDTPLRAPSFCVRATLPNGIEVDLGQVDVAGLASVLRLLGGTACSALKRS